MIAANAYVICPSCQDQREDGSKCWACQNRGYVEAWRVCSYCGQWKLCCTCARGSKIVSIFKRRPAPEPPAISEKSGGGEEPLEQAPTEPEEIETGRPAPTVELDLPGQPVKPPPSSRLPLSACWMGVRACGMVPLTEGFHYCRRCGAVHKEYDD